MKILNNEQEHLSALHIKESNNSALQEITKRLATGENKTGTHKRNLQASNAIRNALLSSDKNETRLARTKNGQREPLIANDKETISDTPTHILGSRATTADTQNMQPLERIPLIA
ncbi:unnamed protein product [Litomosoides sigmodontis]|uniref:Uncharacterized protein n=1 Tax=Litomosoides sigmodontis TaxID=42156 RepID=A0A3P6UQC0_LITSI|nr:unnamed protein product [Litomosoides sigmodontis]